MAFVTYLYLDPKTSVPRYVGKGVNVRRAKAHLNSSTNPQLHALIQKRKNEGFVMRPQIIEAQSNDDAIEMEMLLIAMIGREDLGLGSLFNKTDGGEGLIGNRKSLETKLKHAQAMLDKTPEELAKIRDKTRLSRASKSAEELASSFAKRSLARKQMHSLRSNEERSQNSANAGKATRKACTIDGVTIFQSRLALVAALGQSKSGARSPNFRYV